MPHQRDDRDPRDRGDRDLIRPRVDRVSHEPSPSTTKDISPPPIAPSAPAFGSVPSRQPSSTDLQTLTGKAPPTGPRALTEDRSMSASLPTMGDRQPPTGPSKPTLPDGSPPIPVGPRAQQQKQQRSSKQWINPAIVANKKIPESPKINRSQSFVSQQGRPPPFGYRPESSHSDQHGDFERRPRSSGAKSEPQVNAADIQLRGLHISEANGVPLNLQRGTRSARASVDRDSGFPYSARDSKASAAETANESKPRQHADGPPSLTGSKIGTDKESRTKLEASDHSKPSSKPKRPTAVPTPVGKISLPARQPLAPVTEQSSESDDEDMDIYFDSEMAKAEAELKKLESVGGSVPTAIVARYVAVSIEAMARVASEAEGINDMVGPVPEGFTFPPSKADGKEPGPAAPSEVDEARSSAPAAPESAPIPTVELGGDSSIQPEPQPKVEEMDTDGSGLPPAISVPTHARVDDVDTEMDGAAETEEPLIHMPQAVGVNGVPVDASRLLTFPPDYGEPLSRRTSPSQMEDDDETEEEEIDFASIETVREYMKTPPLDELPDYALKPWYRSKKVRNACETSNDIAELILLRMHEELSMKIAEQEDLKRDYRQRYDSYLRFTMSDDPAAVKSRDHFASSSVPHSSTATTKPVAVPEAKLEGGRRTTNRFSTELDLEYVIQQSIREHQEAQEREARTQREKYRSEKEAVIPEMYWTQEDRDRELYLDTTGLLPVDRLVGTWQVLPPVINFTEEEAEQFETAYLELPKQWGNIAKRVPTRDFKACIQYYYAKKTELNLKAKLKKQPRKRKRGRAKQRSSALVSELGNIENDGEEGQENGENGERRRPRRAAAPTWGFETAATPTADSDGTQSTTPGRRGAGSKNDNGGEKAETKKGRRTRVAKDKDAKTPKPAQALAPTPPASKANRSRSNSRAQGPEWVQQPQPQSAIGDVGRLPTQFEMPPGGMQPPMAPVQQAPLASPERVPLPLPSSISEVMAPPSLRPEPLPPPASLPTFDLGQGAGLDRVRTPQQASSYWSVSESNDFPGLLRSFGTDWGSIAAHMQTKTAVMVCPARPLLSSPSILNPSVC